MRGTCCGWVVILMFKSDVGVVTWKYRPHHRLFSTGWRIIETIFGHGIVGGIAVASDKSRGF